VNFIGYKNFFVKNVKNYLSVYQGETIFSGAVGKLSIFAG
jgi:hypothetical protein